MAVPTITLNNGVEIPQLGLGVFQIPQSTRSRSQPDPAVNQIEVHPYLSQNPLREFNSAHGIATEAWSPIAQGDVLDDPVLARIAAETGRSTAQVTLRWHVQRGDIVFPKSVTRSRVEENYAIFDFELSATQVAAIEALNVDKRRGPDPDVFDRVP